MASSAVRNLSKGTNSFKVRRHGGKHRYGRGTSAVPTCHGGKHRYERGTSAVRAHYRRVMAESTGTSAVRARYQRVMAESTGTSAVRARYQRVMAESICHNEHSDAFAFPFANCSDKRLASKLHSVWRPLCIMLVPPFATQLASVPTIGAKARFPSRTLERRRPFLANLTHLTRCHWSRLNPSFLARRTCRFVCITGLL